MHTQGWAAACNDFPLLTPCCVETSVPAVGVKVYPDAVLAGVLTDPGLVSRFAVSCAHLV